MPACKGDKLTELTFPTSIGWVKTPLDVPQYKRYPTISGAGFGSQASVTLWANRKGLDPNVNRAKMSSQAERAVNHATPAICGKKWVDFFVRKSGFFDQAAKPPSYGTLRKKYQVYSDNSF